MSPAHQTVPTKKLFNDLQVLVVDNDRDSCYLYAVLLGNLGAIVTIANSIQEALEVLKWLLPHIVICEMRFYGESIHTLITKLRELESDRSSHIPTIAITAWVGDSLTQILEANFESYLLKPIDLEQLVSLIRNFVFGRRKNPLLIAWG